MTPHRLALAVLPLALAACATSGTASKSAPAAQKHVVQPAQGVNPSAPMHRPKTSPYAPAQEDPSKRGDYVAGGLYRPGEADTVPDYIPDVDAIPEPEVRDEPRARTGNKSYSVLGKRYQVLDSAHGYQEEGGASYYGKKFHGRRTSSGEVYDMYAFTAAHKSLPLPSYARVTNLDNGKSVVVRVNDRGPFHSNRIIDLSYAAAVKLVYFRQLDGSDYVPRPELVDVARRWRVYQGREYFAYVFNRLLRWVSRRGLAATDGGLTVLPKGELWALVDDAVDGSSQGDDLGLALPVVDARTRVSSLLEGLLAEVNTSHDADGIWPRTEGFDEHALYTACREYDEDDGRTVVALLAMVLLLRERFGLPSRALEYAKEQVLVAEGGSLRIGMARFMHQLNQRMLRDPTLGELARWLIEDFVIVQHERVATAKLPDDTYRVRRIGDAVRFFAQESPAVFNDSRFRALSTTVHELGWVSTFNESHRELTESGQRLLVDGDLPGGDLADAAAPFGEPDPENA